MPKKTEKNLLVGLDIGTSKVVAIVGEVMPDGAIEVVGIGSHPSRGLKKGVVVNIESTVHSIQRAVEEAEMMAGCKIHLVYAGIAGSHISSLNSHGIVAIRDKEVSSGDVDRVIDAARAVAIPADQKILHILPQEFVIDFLFDYLDLILSKGVPPLAVLELYRFFCKRFGLIAVRPAKSAEQAPVAPVGPEPSTALSGTS